MSGGGDVGGGDVSIRTCADFDSCAAEFALGVLPALQRSQALSHLERCPGCRASLSELAGVGDALVEVPLGVEPPLGFQRRDLKSLCAPARGALRGLDSSTRKPSNAHRPRWATAAAALTLVIGVGAIGAGGWALGRSESHPGTVTPTVAPRPVATGRLLSAKLVAGDQAAGQVFLYSGRPRWMYMTVAVGKTSQWVSCQLTRPGGSTVTVGSFWLSAGRGGWASQIPANIRAVSGARIVGSDGRILAAAQLRLQ